MLQKIKNMALIAALTFGFVAPFAVGGSVAAVDLGDCNGNGNTNSINQSLNQGINSATAGTTGCDSTTSGSGPSSLQDVAQKVVNFLSVIVGVIAVIMIIVGGFKYITSGGDSGNVSGAKNTLIYAIVGLIIVALAQFIVNFVLSNITN